jgi:hypothetical protein
VIKIFGKSLTLKRGNGNTDKRAVTGFENALTVRDNLPGHYAPHGTRPAFQSYESEDINDLFMIVPRLREMRRWLTVPTYNTLWYLHWREPTTRFIIEKVINNVRGDGVGIIIYEDEIDDKSSSKKNQTHSINLDLTRKIKIFLDNLCGKGRSFSSKLIADMIRDNYVFGRGHYYIWMPEYDSPLEEPDEWTIRRVDPRTTVVHDQDRQPAWKKLIQFPVVQLGSFNRFGVKQAPSDKSREESYAGQPESYEDFMNWVPSIRGPYMNYSSMGRILWDKPIVIPWDNMLNTEFWGESPCLSILEHQIEKIKLTYMIDVGIKRYSHPFLYGVMHRNPITEGNETKFRKHMKNFSKRLAQMNFGDSMAISGKLYNTRGQVISEGQEIHMLNTEAGVMDYKQIINYLDANIARGLFLSPALVDADFGDGKMATAHGGKNELNILVRSIRTQIEDVMKPLIAMYVKDKEGKEIPKELIEFIWPKMGENDPAVMADILFRAADLRAITPQELRRGLNVHGTNLPEMSNEELVKSWEPFDLVMQEGRPTGSKDSDPGNTGNRTSGYRDRPEKRASNVRQVLTDGGGKTGREGD